jgi:tRNA-dihydrouridine synthase
VTFYGAALGLKVFRKHLGWYVLGAPLGDAAWRRQAKSRLCRIDDTATLMASLHALWAEAGLFSGEPAPI